MVEILPQICSLLLLMPVGVMVLLTNPRNGVYRHFFVMTTALAMTYAGAVVRHFADDASHAMLGTTILQVGLCATPFLIFRFVVRFLEIKARPIVLLRNIGDILALFWITVVVVDALYPLSLLMTIDRVDGRYQPVSLGVAGHVYLLFFIAYNLLSIGILIRALRRSTGVLHHQLKHVLTGYALAAAGGVVGILLRWNAFPAVTSAVWYAMIAYAITRYQFLEIRIAVRLGTIYATVSAILLGAYVGMVFVMVALFGRILPPDSWLFPICGIVLVALICHPVRNSVQRVIDRAFFRERVDYDDAGIRVHDRLSSVLSMTELAAVAVDAIRETLQPSAIGFLIREGEGEVGRWIVAGSRGAVNGWKDEVSRDAAALAVTGNGLLTRDQLEFESRMAAITDERRSLQAIMERHGIEVTIPLIVQGGSAGLLAVGRKLSEEPINAREVDFLRSVGSLTSVALRNVRLLEKVEEMERDRHREDKLAALGAFASEIAHEMKNPLVPLKTYAQVMHQKIHDPGFRQRLLEIVPREIGRLDEIVERTLKGWLIRTEERRPVDLDTLVRSTIALFEYELLKRDVRVTIEGGDGGAVNGDERQLRQVVQNLLLNALEAMPGGGRVTIATRRKGNVNVVAVSDTGCGMTEAQSKDIFRPFYTTKANGTGIGLAVCKRIVANHNGEIRVESEPGKGSTFFVEFH